jgi:hypothetical protein
MEYEIRGSHSGDINITAFWNVTPCRMNDVSEEHNASIFIHLKRAVDCRQKGPFHWSRRLVWAATHGNSGKEASFVVSGSGWEVPMTCLDRGNFFSSYSWIRTQFHSSFWYSPILKTEVVCFFETLVNCYIAWHHIPEDNIVAASGWAWIMNFNVYKKRKNVAYFKVH